MLTVVHYFAAAAGKRSGCESHEDRGLLTLIFSEGPGLQAGAGLSDAHLHGGPLTQATLELLTLRCLKDPSL